MKIFTLNFLSLFILLLSIQQCVTAQVVRPFTARYSNPSVRGNIVYVSNSIISTSGVGPGVPGTGEIAPTGVSRDNNGNGIDIDIDNTAWASKLPFGSVWNYFANNTAPANDGSGNTWKQSAYTLTGAWNTGASPVSGAGKYGYSSGQTTCLPSGQTPICTPAAGNKYTAYYFRRTVNLTALELSTTFTHLQLNMLRNDGIVVYINGVERVRNNMPTGTIAHATLASANIAPGTAEAVSVNLSTAFFTAGANTISVEVHLRATNAVDMSFDMEVLGYHDNGTFNSSSSDLNIPTACNTVLFAGLYWGADQGANGTDVSWMVPSYNTIKLKIPGSAVYQNVVSTQTNTHNNSINPSLSHTGYLCFANITSLINTTNANGTYTVANMVGPIGIANSCGGWTIVIVYSNPSLLPRNLTVFDGSVIINGGDPAVDVNISGFLTPPAGPVSCELGSVVYDGDRGQTDSFAFRQNGAPSFYNLASAAVPFNGSNDAWNSKISYKNAIVTSRVPAFQNTLGYDASIFDLPNASNVNLSNNQTAATVRFASPSENYFVHVLSTSISQYNPTFAVTKTATDLNGGLIRAGDSLRYQVNYRNVGNDTSTQTIIIDNIPSGASYKRGSMNINGVAKTDAAGDDEAEYDFVNNRVIFRLGTGANASTGGAIPINTSGYVYFDVYLASSCRILNCSGDSVKNIARISYVGLRSNTSLYDSSGVDIAGCLTNGPVTNFVTSSCSVPKDTLLINNCPVTNVFLPARRFAGYSFYRAQPFTAANLFDPTTPINASRIYWAHFTNSAGCSDTIRINVIVTPCPDIDDDNDGIPDYVEFNHPLALQDHNSNGIPNWNDPAYPGYVDHNIDNVNDNFDWGADSDNDGIPNFADPDFWIPWVDINSDGINDASDKDLDGIPNQYDLDSDNDGIPDVVESYGVDTNGDGIIDNYTDTDNDGFSQNVDANNTGVNGSGVGLGAQDLDGDGIPNYLDLDSDNDGIPDVIEAGAADANNDGMIDGFYDSDGDGLSDNVDGDVGNDGIAENAINALLRTGPDLAPVDGRADSYPFKNMDNDSRANPYDLDSDGDGIVDVIEAGFPDTDFNGRVDGAIGSNGWNIAVDNQPTLNLRNTDGRGNPDYLDIDSDDDGIPDNIEGQTTAGYQFPTYLDTDNDGIDNRYDNVPAAWGGSGIFVTDKDGDGIPDYRDLDTDADGIPDIVEGNDFNLNGIADDDVALTYLDTDGDGLDDKFDALNSVTNIRGTSNRMGTLGSFTGDPTPGSRTPVQRTIASQSDRDWRYVGYVLPLQHFMFSATDNSNTVNLDWSIISAMALDGFVIERSTDNIKFEKITSIKANITTGQLKNFAYADDIRNVNNTVIFYRLKVIAVNGQEKYSNTVVIKKQSIKTQLTVFPNPAQDLTSLIFYAENETEVTISLKNNVGKEIYIQKIKGRLGNNSFPLSGLSKHNNGVYIIQLLINNEVITRKLVIQN